MGECHLDASQLMGFICRDSGNPHVVIGVDETLKSSAPAQTVKQIKRLIDCSRKERMVLVIGTSVNPFTVEPSLPNVTRTRCFVPLRSLPLKLEKYPELNQLIESRHQQGTTGTSSLASAKRAVEQALEMTGGYARSIENLFDIVENKTHIQCQFDSLV